jgi:hypothetical protein
MNQKHSWQTTVKREDVLVQNIVQRAKTAQDVNIAQKKVELVEFVQNQQKRKQQHQEKKQQRNN